MIDAVLLYELVIISQTFLLNHYFFYLLYRTFIMSIYNHI